MTIQSHIPNKEIEIETQQNKRRIAVMQQRLQQQQQRHDIGFIVVVEMILFRI